MTLTQQLPWCSVLLLWCPLQSENTIEVFLIEAPLTKGNFFYFFPGGENLFKFLQCTKLHKLLVKPTTYRTILREKWQIAKTGSLMIMQGI
jgi:hypothetical protein